MGPEIEANVAIVQLSKLMELQLDHLELSPLAKVACKCLKIDPAKRATASQVLNALPPVCEVCLSKCS